MFTCSGTHLQHLTPNLEEDLIVKPQLYFCTLVFAACLWPLSAFAANTAPADITGTWSGAAKAVVYNKGLDANGQPLKKNPPTRGSADLTAAFVQTNGALSLNLTLVTHDKTGSGDTLNGHLTGAIGNGAFWVSGITSSANSIANIVMTGHVSARGISGLGISFSDNDAEFTYSLKRSGAQPLLTPSDSIPPEADTASADSSIFQIAGSANGKQFLFSGTTGKPSPFKSGLTGTIIETDTSRNGTLTFATGSIVFSVTGPKNGQPIVLTGNDMTGTKHLILSLHPGAKDSAKGVGFLYGSDSFDEFKISVKKQ